MTEYSGARIPAMQMVRGYIQAYERFEGAVRDDEGADRASYALFEALNWAVAFDVLVCEIWRPTGQKLDFAWRQFAGGPSLQDLLDGVRYARNLVHHHWADALQHVDVALLPAPLPAPFFTWVWRDASELPQPPNAHKSRVVEQRDSYERRLAGSRAEETLNALAEEFSRVGTFLDPPRPANRN